MDSNSLFVAVLRHFSGDFTCVFRDILPHININNGKYRTFCPFHDSHSEAFCGDTTGPYAGFWCCFACGQRGGIVEFVEESVGDPEYYFRYKWGVSRTMPRPTR